MPRPGFVLEVDRSTPPILFHHGEGFRLEKLPAGRSRVLYPAEPLEALEDPDATIRHALDNPLGDSPPLRALLKPGMKLTIAFDDISLPLPPMRRPRRQPSTRGSTSTRVVGPVGLEPTTKGFTSPAVSGGSGLSLHPPSRLGVGAGRSSLSSRALKLSGSLCTVRRCTAGLAQGCRRVAAGRFP